MSEELKPVRCGCGGEAIILKADEYHQFPDTYYVSCTKCTAGVGPYDTKAEAVTTWNKAMGATDMNVGDKERTVKAEWSEPDGCYLCGGCGRQVEKIDSYCAECGAKLDWSEE